MRRVRQFVRVDDRWAANPSALLRSRQPLRERPVPRCKCAPSDRTARAGRRRAGPSGSLGFAESTRIGSASLRTPTPRSARSWMRLRVSRTVRPSRSRVCTTITSPSRAYSSTAFSPGRSVVAPTSCPDRSVSVRSRQRAWALPCLSRSRPLRGRNPCARDPYDDRPEGRICAPLLAQTLDPTYGTPVTRRSGPFGFIAAVGGRGSRRHGARRCFG